MIIQILIKNVRSIDLYQLEIKGGKIVTYLFFLNKNPLFEKSDPDLKGGVFVNTCFCSSGKFDFLPKNQQKNVKNFPAASPRIFPKKGGSFY